MMMVMKLYIWKAICEVRMKSKMTGFTLMEVLVAFFIFVIIMGIVVSGISLSVKSESLITEKTAALGKLQSAIAIMDRDFLQIVERPVLDSNGILLPPVLVGAIAGTSIEFTRIGFANPFSMSKRSTLLRVAYEFEGSSLVRRTWPVLDRAPNTESSSRVLLDNLTNMNILFLNKEKEFFEPAGDDLLSQQVPLGIMVELAFKDDVKLTRLYPLVRGLSDAN